MIATPMPLKTPSPSRYRLKTLMKSITLCLSFLISVVFSISSMAETKLVQPWSNRAFISDNGPFENILVIAVTEEPKYRPILEKAFAERIEKKGAAATLSSSIMPTDAEMSEQAIKAAVAEHGANIEIVLLTRLYRIDEVDIVQIDDPGTMRSERDFALALGRDYRDARDFALDAEVKKRLRFILENSIYDLESAELIWTVQSYSMDPKTAEELIKSVSKLVTDKLKEEDLI